MRKFALLLIFLLAAVTSAASAQTDSGTRVFEPLDRSLNYRFAYPLASHSVRTTNLFEPADAPLIVYGALAAVEPNDSYLYAGPSMPESATTQMRILAIPNVQPPSDLADLVGTLPLWQAEGYTGEVEDITLGGQPAVRMVDADRQATEIVVYYEGVVYEIVIDVVPPYLGFRLSEGVGYDPVYDEILSSWEFVELTA